VALRSTFGRSTEINVEFPRIGGFTEDQGRMKEVRSSVEIFG
jgi:hypothetical protein